jgi:hypothetical protein
MDKIGTSATTLQGHHNGMDGPSQIVTTNCRAMLIGTSMRSMIADPFHELRTHGWG